MNEYDTDPTYALDDEPAKPQRKVYVKNSELYEELVKWRDSSPDKDKRVASEKLGEMLMKIATHYMNHPNYVRYPQWIKDEIISSSVYAMLTSLHCFKFEYKNPFAYFTQICWSCAMDYLTKYYKFVNFKRDKMKEYIADQIEEGVNVHSGAQYLKMLNDLTPISKDEETELMENQEFIDNLLANRISTQKGLEDNGN